MNLFYFYLINSKLNYDKQKKFFRECVNRRTLKEPTFIPEYYIILIILLYQYQMKLNVHKKTRYSLSIFL